MTSNFTKSKLPPLRGFTARAALVALPLILGACATDTDRGAPTQTIEDATVTALPALMRIAADNRDRGDLKTAAQTYQRAHALYPNEAQPLVGLGEVQAETGAHDKAVDAFRDALARDPFNEAAQRGLGEALIMLDQGIRALAQYERLLERGPDDFVALNGKGVALDSLRRHDEAQRAYRAGLRLAPNNIALRNNLGLSLVMSGKHDEAIRLLQALVQEPGAPEQVERSLAFALERSRQGQERVTAKESKRAETNSVQRLQSAAFEQGRSYPLATAAGVHSQQPKAAFSQGSGPLVLIGEGLPVREELPDDGAVN